MMADRVKVDRECPRCHVRAYHWGNDMGVPHRIRCASCGHCWTGRIRADEQKNLYREGWEPPLDGTPIDIQAAA